MLYSISRLNLRDDAAILFHRWYKMPEGLYDAIAAAHLPQADELQIKILISETEVGIRNLELTKCPQDKRLIDVYVEFTKLAQNTLGSFDMMLHMNCILCALYRLFEEGSPDYDMIPEHRITLAEYQESNAPKLKSAVGLNEIRQESADSKSARKYCNVKQIVETENENCIPIQMTLNYDNLNPQSLKVSLDSDGNVISKIQEERMRQYFGWSQEELQGLCMYLERVYPDVSPETVVETFKIDPDHRKLFEMCSDGMDLAGFVELYTRKQISFNRGLSFFDGLLQRYGSSTLTVFHSALSELI